MCPWQPVDAPTHADEVIYLQVHGVSISQADLDNGSPKTGDMIARIPLNHNDQWLVAKQYFDDNFKEYRE